MPEFCLRNLQPCAGDLHTVCAGGLVSVRGPAPRSALADVGVRGGSPAPGRLCWDLLAAARASSSLPISCRHGVPWDSPVCRRF